MTHDHLSDGERSLEGERKRLWSGLSESNRHLNLGKVPYYHYTKAAQPQSLYSTLLQQQQVLRVAPFLIHSTVNHLPSGNLTDARSLDDRRPALPFGKTRRLVFVGVHPAKLLAICIVNRYQPMVMLPSPVLTESTLLFARRFLGSYFRHSDFPVLEGR
jgi:hypothetical protein